MKRHNPQHTLRILLSFWVLGVLAISCTSSDFFGSGRSSQKNGSDPGQPTTSPYPPGDPRNPYPPGDPRNPYPPGGPNTTYAPGDPNNPYPPGDPRNPIGDPSINPLIPGTTGGPGTNGYPPGLGITGDHACVSGPVDMNMMLLLDTTGSMKSQNKALAEGIPTLNQQIMSIRSSLGNKLGKFRLGFIGYIDQARINNGTPLVLAPTEDLNAAQSFILTNAQASGDNSDDSEGGGWAFLQALNYFQTVNPTGNALNVAVVVTDAWSHDGDPCGNDCHGSRTFKWNLFETALQTASRRGTMIFDWSPTNKGANGDDEFTDGTRDNPLFGSSPKGQWDALRLKITQLGGFSGAGAHLGEKISSGPAGMQQIISIVQQQVKLCP